MKSLVMSFLLSSLIFLGIGCSDFNDINKAYPLEQSGLEQSEIKSKIAGYYSSPSSSTQLVANIQTVFFKQFPNATDIEWKVSNNVYEIDFEINKVDHEAWYDSEANLLMYKYDIANNELPSAVSSVISTDYPGYVIDDAEKVYKGNIVGYYVDLDKNKVEIRAFYKEDGTFISKNLWEDDSVKPANDADMATPEIAGSLSDDEVDALITAYYSENDKDILSSNVPSIIQGNFNSVFLGVRDIDWEMSANIYKADFEINNVDYNTWYKEDGTLLAYKFDITRSSLPQGVKAAVSSLYAGYTIDDADKVVKAGSIGYFVELENRNMEEDAYFGEGGTYISDSFYKKGTTSGTDPETPEIPVDGNYTDEEIDALLLIYQQGKDKDIVASSVPAPVTSAFGTQFTSARDIEWDYVSNIYKVEFEVGNVDYEAWYVEDGAILMYVMETRYNAVASVVQNAVLSQYPQYRIDECDYFQKGSIKGYIIEIENKKTDAELTVVYQENGTFISQHHD